MVHPRIARHATLFWFFLHLYFRHYATCRLVDVLLMGKTEFLMRKPMLTTTSDGPNLWSFLIIVCQLPLLFLKLVGLVDPSICEEYCIILMLILIWWRHCMTHILDRFFLESLFTFVKTPSGSHSFWRFLHIVEQIHFMPLKTSTTSLWV